MTFRSLSKTLLVVIFVAVCSSVSAQEDEQIKVVDLSEVIERAKKREAENRKPMRFKIKLEPKLAQADRIVWQGYGTLRHAYRNDNSIPFPEKPGDVTPTFLEEVEGRKGIVVASNGLSIGFKEPLKSYLSDLGEVVRAGFLKEYVWKYHHRESWQKPEDLKVKRFNDWAEENLDRAHKGLTSAVLACDFAPKAKATKIYLDKKMIKSKSDAVVWMRYGLGRFGYLHKHPKKFNAYVNQVVWPGFEEEVAGRTHICDGEGKLTQSELSKGVRNYLKCLVKVHEEGYIKEYVWTHHSREDWKQPTDLKLEEFKQWSEKQIPDHSPIQGAALVGR